ncbi:MAG: DUF1638 domain-containing protein, partial [Alphaproteobacteria bacterium]|nr:DUF1638 domain-containing protein [Alphaproteobacteria bacterium]
MDAKLRIVACSYFAAEVKATLERLGATGEDFELSSFTAHCDGPAKTDPVLDALPHDLRAPDERIRILSGPCQTCAKACAKSANGPLFLDTDNCFSILLGGETVDGLLAGGTHMLTPAMLADWRDIATEWGFDEHGAKAFFGESTTRFVIFDAGLTVIDTLETDAFSAYTGVPVEIRPITLDHLALYLTLLHRDWMRERKRALHRHQARDLRRRIADMSMTFDLMRKLTVMLDEDDIIKGAVEMFSMLCAPEKIQFLRYGPGGAFTAFPKNDGKLTGLAEMADDIIPDEPLWRDEYNGFCLPVLMDDDVLGIVVLEGIAFPERAAD